MNGVNKMKIHINAIKYNNSLVDGPGIRTIVYFQGCDLRCPGCHNPSTWEIGVGQEYEVGDLVEELKSKVINRKITISGGEPLLQKKALSELLNSLDGFDIALYTGHENDEVPNEIRQHINYLKTGRFIASKKTTTTPYFGSSNQEFKQIRNTKHETNNE